MTSFSPITPSFSAIEVDTEQKPVSFSPIEAKPKRDPQYAKQFGAGILDIGAGLPALAGLAITPLKAGYHMATDGDGFGDALIKGLDNPAMRLAGDMHEGINDLVGVDEPQGLEQLARLAPVLIPTPASVSNAITKGAGAASKALNITSRGGQQAVELAAQLAVPLTQVTEKASFGIKAGQVAAQGAANIAADQGIRAASGMPTMFEPINDALIENPVKTGVSAAAIVAAGIFGTHALAQRARSLEELAKKAAINDSIPGQMFKEPNTGALKLSTKAGGLVADTYDVLHDQVLSLSGDAELARDVVGGYKVNPAAAAQAFTVTRQFPDSSIIVPKGSGVSDIMSDLNAVTPDERDLFSKYAGAANELSNRAKATMQALDVETISAKGDKPSSYIEQRIARVMKAINNVKEEIANTNKMIDERDGIPTIYESNALAKRERYLKAIEENLNFWNTFGETEFVTGKSGKQWRVRSAGDGSEQSVFAKNLTVNEQLEFLDDIGARRIETGLFVGDTKEPLLNSPRQAGKDARPASESQLWNTIELARNNPTVMALAKKYATLSESMLKYMVASGRISERLASKWASEHTVDGLMIYMHGREMSDPNFSLAARVKYLLGWNTPEADDAAKPWLTRVQDRIKAARASVSDAALRQKEFESALPPALSQEALTYGQGIRNPMAPMHALESMIASLFEHVQQNKARLNAMNTFDRLVKNSAVGDKTYDTAAIVKRYDVLDVETGKRIQVERNGKMVDDIDDELHAAIKSRHGNNLSDVEKDMLISVFENGRQVRFYVPNKAMQHALQFHPNLVTGLNSIGAFTKNFYQALTTRNIFFAIPQAFYSTMLQMVNAPAHGLLFGLGDAARGIKEALVTGLGLEASQHLDRITASIPFFQKYRPLAERFKEHMNQVVQKSLMMELVSRTGGASSGSMTIESMTKTARVFDHWAGALQMNGTGNVYGPLKGIWRMGSIINRAIQDGPTIGLMLKAYEKELKGSYATIARPKEINGTKIKYGPTGKIETPYVYYDGIDTIHIDIDAIKQSYKDGTWRKDNEFFKTVPDDFRDADDLAEFIMQHELAHVTQKEMRLRGEKVPKAGSVEREADANNRAASARSEQRNTAAKRANVVTKNIAGDYTAFGSSDTVRAIRAWIPFAGAALQGMRALGKAWSKDPAKTAAAITVAVAVPAIAELAFLYNMATDEQKEKYWKTGDSTRLSNIMIPHPDGKSFTLIPVEPSLRVVRAIFMEGLDAITNWSNDYRPYKVEIADGSEVETGQFRHAVITGLQSVINLPLPPLMQAGLAAGGNSFVLGVDPNSESGIGGFRPLAGQQVTAMGRDQSSLPNSVMSSNMEGVIAALTGFVGTLALSTFNQFNVGTESNVVERFDRAVGEVSSKLGTYSRVGTLFGLDEATRLTRASHIDRELRPMIQGMKQMQAIVASATRGNMLSGGVMPAGNAPLAPDDYDTITLAANAAALAGNPRFKQAAQRVSTAFQQLSVIKGSDRIHEENIGMLPWLSGREGEPWSRADKVRAENDLARVINQERVMQLFLMKQHEEMFGFKFSDYAGRSPPIILGKDIPEIPKGEVFEATPEMTQQGTQAY